MNHSFQMRLAHSGIRVIGASEQFKTACSSFLTDDSAPAEFTVSVDPERMKAEQAEVPGISACCAESRCLLKQVIQELPQFRAIMFHGACIAYEGRAYIFAAPSGTGKTTHVRLWKQQFGDKVTVINGDKPVLYMGDTTIEAFSSPWAGKENWFTPFTCSLGAICFLERGEQNSISPVYGEKAVECLFKQIPLPQKRESLMLTLSYMDRIVTTVPMYIMKCNMTPEAAEMSCKALTVIGKLPL